MELKRAKAHYDVRKKEASFKRGDVVYCIDHAPKNKLCPKWIGPCVVTRARGPFLFRLKHRNREWSANHDSLKLCREENLPAWIHKVKEKMNREDATTYCICKKPDDGLLMVQCQSCLDWFHGKCMKLTTVRAKQIDFLCLECDT